ncbi:MAG: NAD(P)H-hydrate dehydratase [Methylophilaceae bacterium]
MKTAIENHPKLWLALLPKLDASSNKYSRGVSMVIGGFPTTGAARLSAFAAARVGSGLTILAVPKVAFAIYASAVTSIMVKPFEGLDDFNEIAQDSRISCFLIGPGAGLTADTKQQVIYLLNTQKPIVIDADAITVFQNKLDTLSGSIHTNCVLTPHEGEFKRLFPLDENREKCALHAAKTIGATIVLKGPKTLIASPDGSILVNNNAPASLATGGSGDVLAGLIAGLIAQGMPPFYAAAAAVWIHTEAANFFGVGLIADDLPNLIPSVLKTLYAQ